MKPVLTVMDRIRLALVTGLGAGYSPHAPGTLGTLGALLVVLALLPLGEQPWFHFGAAILVLAGLCLVVGIPLSSWAERHFGRKDPQVVVIDEWLGFFVALVRLGDGVPGWKELLVAFLAFRLFDVAKPPPVRNVEKLPRGYGIMLDDLVAGVYAAMLVSVCREWFGWS